MTTAYSWMVPLLVVLGLMLDVLRSLGSGIDEQIIRERRNEVGA